MEHNKLLTELSNGLTEVRDYTVKSLEDNGFGMLALTAKTKLEQVINMINHTLGGGASLRPVASMEFPPVTNFMGEELKTAKPVVQEELSPAEARKKQFIEDVDALESTFSDREDKDILAAFSLKEQQVVLRGLAKRYELENFKSAKIDAAFLQQIRDAMEKKALADKHTETEENKLVIAKDEDLS